MSSLNNRSRRRLPPFAAGALFICLVSVSITAQTGQSNSLPRVGTIKDYPATGLMVGCGNLYFYKASDTRSGDSNYVFLSRGDGTHAWMNLNGRDVLLRKIKSPTRQNQKIRRHSYRHGNVRITVEFEDFAAEGSARESDHMFKMKITLRNGRAGRVVRAVGDADC